MTMIVANKAKSLNKHNFRDNGAIDIKFGQHTLICEFGMFCLLLYLLLFIIAKFCNVTIPISPIFLIFVKSGLFSDFQEKFSWFFQEFLKKRLLCVTTRH